MQKDRQQRRSGQEQSRNPSRAKRRVPTTTEQSNLQCKAILQDEREQALRIDGRPILFNRNVSAAPHPKTKHATSVFGRPRRRGRAGNTAAAAAPEGRAASTRQRLDDSSGWLMKESWGSFHAASRPCQSRLTALARLYEGTRSRDISTGSWTAHCLLLAIRGTSAGVDCHLQGPAWPAVVNMF